MKRGNLAPRRQYGIALASANNMNSGEVQSQGAQHFVGDVGVDCRESRGNRHTPEYLWDSLAEAYAESRCDIHVHFRARFVEGGIAGNWCALFNRVEDRFDVADVQVVRNEIARTQLCEKDDMGQPMLVHVGKLVELPKGIAVEPVPSIVRLQLLDDCLRGWRDAPDVALAFREELIALEKDGEHRVFLDLLRQRFAQVVGDGEFKGKVVERSPEVVDAVPDDEAEFDGRWVEHFDPCELVEVINIEIRPSSVRVFFLPGSHFGLKALQVIERPVQSSFVVERHASGSMPKDRIVSGATL